MATGSWLLTANCAHPMSYGLIPWLCVFSSLSLGCTSLTFSVAGWAYLNVECVAFPNLIMTFAELFINKRCICKMVCFNNISKSFISTIKQNCDKCEQNVGIQISIRTLFQTPDLSESIHDQYQIGASHFPVHLSYFGSHTPLITPVIFLWDQIIFAVRSCTVATNCCLVLEETSTWNSAGFCGQSENTFEAPSSLKYHQKLQYTIDFSIHLFFC